MRVPLWLSGLVTLPGLLSMYCKSVRTCSLLDPNLQKGLYIILFMDTSLLLAKKLNIFFWSSYVFMRETSKTSVNLFNMFNNLLLQALLLCRTYSVSFFATVII